MRKRLTFIILILLCVAPLGGQTAHGITVGISETNNADLATGFNIYRSTVSGSGYVKLNPVPLPATTTSYLDPISGLTGGTTYFYVATSVDSLGIESKFSKEASAVAPGSNPPVVTATPQ